MRSGFSTVYRTLRAIFPIAAGQNGQTPRQRGSVRSGTPSARPGSGFRPQDEEIGPGELFV